MSNDDLIIENMDLSHIHLAVPLTVQENQTFKVKTSLIQFG